MELSQYQPGRLYAREDGGGSRRAEGALYLAAAWLRSKGAKVTPRCGTEERFSSFCLFVSSSPPLSSSLFLSVPLFLSFFNVHLANTANSLKTKDLKKDTFDSKF